MKKSNPPGNDAHFSGKPQKKREPIAIVGMSCRFPQASNLNEFWELLKNGVDTIKEIPADRWNLANYYDPDPSTPRKTYQRLASMLDNIHDFDPFFFNISPAEAAEMNPSQKLMLELAWEAFENSNLQLKTVLGKKAGVYIGSIWSDYQHLRKHKNAHPTSHSSMGQSSDLIANRVSFNFGFTGPSLVVDTGCSSSLVALNFACQSLWDGTNEMALAGGINILMDPDQYVLLSQFGGLSFKGKCSTFDAEADGFVRGEGAGLIVLKRLSDAERDGNKIYAVIRGTAVNNNGFNVNLPATSVEGQMRVFEDAYADSGVQPHEVHYVEAHGTGTKLGDPTEAKALGRFFREGRGDRKLYIGSVKTNLGHTEASAGIAGLLKVVLAMQHRVLPPNLNFKTPNPEIPFEELKLKVNDALNQWPVNEGEKLKAGVNSFGWGGTNAHAIIEEYVPGKENKKSEKTTRYSLPLSARSQQALKDYAGIYSKSIASLDEKDIHDFCTASALLKPEFEYRAFFSGADKDELVKQLEDFRLDETEMVPAQKLTENDKVVFVFPGQGSQWLGMGRDLFEKESVFRKVIQDCDVAFRPYADWSLIDQLNATPEASRLNEINVIQPSLFAIQIALARLWMSLGIVPDTVVGHSMGEVAAAHIAGVLSLDDAARVICTRSSLMKRVSGKGGAMAVTELTVEEAEKVVLRYPKLSVAVSNSPKSTVLAGDKESIDQLLAELEGKGLFCKPVKVDVASHSQQMDPLKEDLRIALESIQPQRATINIHSTVKGKHMLGEDMTAEYWVSNLRGTVQFASAMEHLMTDLHSVFIEASPHPVLTNAVNECAERFKAKSVTIGSVFRDKPEHESFYKNLGELYARGYSVNWQEFYRTDRIPFMSLPPYPFQRERYELEDKSSERDGVNSNATYPLLGNAIHLADVFNTYFWETRITLDKFSYLRGRTFNDLIVLPEAVYIEMLLEAVSEIQEGLTPVIEGLKFLMPSLVTDEEPLQLQLKIRKINSDSAVFQFYRKNDVAAKKSAWTLVAEGDMTFYSKHVLVQAPPHTEQAEKIFSGEEYYRSLQSMGMLCNEYFKGLSELERSGDVVTFKIQPDERVVRQGKKYRIHPALMDSFFQPLFSKLVENSGKSARTAWIPSIKQINYFGDIDYTGELHGHATFTHLKKQDSREISYEANLSIFKDGSPIMQFKGITVLSAPKENQENTSGEQRPLSFLESYIMLPGAEEKNRAIEQLVVHHVARIIKTSSARIKPVMTFKGVGIDSLMAIQLRNLLEKDLFVKLSVSMFWAHPSIQEYTAYLKEVLAEHVLNESGLEGDNRQQMMLKDTREVASINYDNDKWFVIPKANPSAKLRVFCFHDAGGSAALFHDWENRLDSNFEVISVEMPGRGRRIAEKPYTNVFELVRDLMPQLEMMLDRPFIFLGHSMGGLIAFEIIRELRKRNKSLPQQLLISSTAGLTSYTKDDVNYKLSDEELVAMYPHLDIKIIGDKELQQLLIGILKADLELIYNYEYAHEEPLDVPILAIHGDDDKRVKRHQIAQWERETNTTFKLVDRPGEHRYIEHDGEFVTNLIRQESIAKQIILVA